MCSVLTSRYIESRGGSLISWSACLLVIILVSCVDADADSPSIYDTGVAGESVDGAVGGVMTTDQGLEMALDQSSEMEIIPPTQVSIATYNVQNLFDFMDDPDRDEGEFTPNVADWSRSTYEAKVSAIAEAITLIDADIIALQEVESDEVLGALASEVKRRGGPDYLYRATSSTRDPRGIALGVLSIYPLSREIGRPISASVMCSNGETLNGSRPEARPIYEVNLWSDGSGGGGGGGAVSLTLLINHWKSRASGNYPCLVREHHRRGAEQTRGLLRDWLSQEPERSVAVLGDFNAEESETALGVGINAYLNAAELNEIGALYNLWGELGVTASSSNNATNSTYLYEGEWFRLDHMMITAPMTRNGGGAWQLSTFELIRDARLLNNGRPFSWNGRTHEGYSDHLPLKMTLSLRR